MGERPNKKKRILLLTAVPILVTGLIGLVILVFNSQHTGSSRQEGGMTTPFTTAVSKTPTKTEAVTITPPPLSVAPSDIVAMVNQIVIPIEMYNTALASDRALTNLLSQPPSNPESILDVLVNGELVWQRADKAGYSLNEDQVTETLQKFLTSQALTTNDLEEALLKEGIPMTAFQAYYGRLLVIEGFSQEEMDAKGLNQSEYMEAVQREAQVSFGPAAVLAQAEQPSIEDTPEVQAEATPTALPDDIVRGTKNGQYGPAFELPALNTPLGDFLSNEDFDGMPILLSFWTTWCPYCSAQTPVLVEAHKRYGDRVQFVGINVEEEQNIVQQYLLERKITYPVLLDLTHQVADLYQVSGFPTTYFIDAAGKIVNRQIGQLTPEQVEQYLGQILATNNP